MKEYYHSPLNNLLTALPANKENQGTTTDLLYNFQDIDMLDNETGLITNMINPFFETGIATPQKTDTVGAIILVIRFDLHNPNTHS